MLCKFWARVFVCFYGSSVEVNNSGGSRGGARGPSPPQFWTKLRPEVLKKNIWRPGPPIYLRAWMTSPPLSQGLDPALNKLVIEGQLHQTPSRGDRQSIRKQFLLQLTHLRTPPYNTVSLKTRRRLNPFLYRFLQFFILLSFFHIPRLSLYALLKFTLGTWRKIGNVLSRFSLMTDCLTKLN